MSDRAEPGTSERPSSSGSPSGAATETGWQATALGCALVLTAVSIDLVLSDSLTLFFDFNFIVACLAVAWVVRLSDVYPVTVLPPLLMLGVFVLVAFVAPELIGRTHDGVIQAVVSGLSTHSLALVSGYALALGCLWLRIRAEHRDVSGQVGF